MFFSFQIYFVSVCSASAFLLLIYLANTNFIIYHYCSFFMVIVILIIIMIIIVIVIITTIVMTIVDIMIDLCITMSRGEMQSFTNLFYL